MTRFQRLYTITNGLQLLKKRTTIFKICYLDFYFEFPCMLYAFVVFFENILVGNISSMVNILFHPWMDDMTLGENTLRVNHFLFKKSNV
jgi:hypothetical protein